MKTFKLMIVAASLALPALADGGHGRGRGHEYRRHGGRAEVFVAPRPAPVFVDRYAPYGADYRDPYYGNYPVMAPYGPPEPMYESCGRMPGPGYVWVNGFWRWGGARYVWAPGFWMRPPHPRASWVAGGWMRGPSGFHFRAGFWR